MNRRNISLCPPLQYTVFDAFSGVVCSVLLIVGSLQANRCFLVTWCILTGLVTIKHLWVVLTHDWTAVEDWISVSFLLFTSLVSSIVWCRLLQINGELRAPRGGDKQRKPVSLALNNNLDHEKQTESVKTPEYFPRRHQPGSPSSGGKLKLIQSAKMIHCVTEGGVTKCFTRTARYVEQVQHQQFEYHLF